MSDLITSKFNNRITSIEQLESIMGIPGKLASNKVINYLDEHCQTFLRLSPFCVLSTSDGKGNCDASPRGDKQGFAFVLDKKTLVLPERPGNRRVDSMRNILESSKVGILFMIPGLDETLRINGKASLVADSEVLEKMVENNKIPQIGIAVKVEECFIHCAKAFKRSGLWNPSTWENEDSLPSAAKMLATHSKIPNITSEEIQDLLDRDYKDKLY